MKARIGIEKKPTLVAINAELYARMGPMISNHMIGKTTWEESFTERGRINM